LSSMPFRSLISFSRGALTEEILDRILKQVIGEQGQKQAFVFQSINLKVAASLFIYLSLAVSGKNSENGQTCSMISDSVG
jgi:hypothetical protein